MCWSTITQPYLTRKHSLVSNLNLNASTQMIVWTMRSSWRYSWREETNLRVIWTKVLTISVREWMKSNLTRKALTRSKTTRTYWPRSRSMYALRDSISCVSSGSSLSRVVPSPTSTWKRSSSWLTSLSQTWSSSSWSTSLTRTGTAQFQHLSLPTK